MNKIERQSSTLALTGDAFDKRSASMSYLRILKHSSLSSKNSAYVRTHAEQSQAALRNTVSEHKMKENSDNKRVSQIYLPWGLESSLKLDI